MSKRIGMMACVIAILMLAVALAMAPSAHGATTPRAPTATAPRAPAATAPRAPAASTPSIAAAIAAAPKPAAPAVSNVWVRLPAVTGRPAGGFAVVTGAAAPDRLLAVAAPEPTRVEMHVTESKAGVSTMRRMMDMAVPARAPMTFEPGGRHLMLYDLPKSLKAGDTLPLTFVFERGGVVRVQAAVRAANAAAPAHAGH